MSYKTDTDVTNYSRLSEFQERASKRPGLTVEVDPSQAPLGTWVVSGIRAMLLAKGYAPEALEESALGPAVPDTEYYFTAKQVDMCLTRRGL